MKDRVAAIIYRRNKVILMHREKGLFYDKQVYNVVPGGGVEDGEIKSIKAPETLIRAAWNRETCQWYETMTKEELLEKRSQKIIEYSKLEEEKKVLENSRFSTTDEIQLVASKMANVEMEINSLASQIEILEA